MNSHRLTLWHTALPDLGESRVQSLRGLLLIDLIDECHICAVWEDQGKLLISRREDVIDRVIGPIKNLNILHVPFLSTTASGRLRAYCRVRYRPFADIGKHPIELKV